MINLDYSPVAHTVDINDHKNFKNQNSEKKKEQKKENV